MSLILLDTHVLIWMTDNSPRIGPQTRSLIERASMAGELCISAMTVWEIAMLDSKGRLNLDRDIQVWIDTVLDEGGLSLMPLAPKIAFASTRLPDGFHSDPADRVIVATARHLHAQLITEDRLILSYAGLGHVNAQGSSS
ncbi:MAG: type II toxin-antitoxin system VapC family toxin [Asticcacaulis sp.]|uniref:type II toxin-antitoxin system VapC family toxin n=1 Tax=Asticcacaulis sp. TaxID=1872648 RepID=UPI003F7B63DB